MNKPRDNRQKDLLRPALDQIIDLGHPLVRLERHLREAAHAHRHRAVGELALFGG